LSDFATSIDWCITLNVYQIYDVGALLICLELVYQRINQLANGVLLVVEIATK